MNESLNKSRLLFIGLEGLDWRLVMHYVDQGQMPNLEALINKSAIGKTDSVEPNMANTLWGSMLTGKRPYKHGIIGIKEYDDSLKALRPLNSEIKKSSDVFDILEFNGKVIHRVGVPLSHPAKSKGGISVSNLYTRNDLMINDQGDVQWPLLPNTISQTSKEALFSNLRVHHTEIQSVFLKNFLQKNYKQDEILHETYILNKIFSETTSFSSATSYLLENTKYDVCAVMFDLIERVFFRYIDGGVDYIKENEHELAGFIYRYIDDMLGNLINLIAANDYLVIAADYGLSSVRVRNTPKKWDKGQEDKSKNNAFFLIKGPQIKQDQLVHNSSILDLGPTILKCFETPCGTDMDGTPLSVFVENSVEDTAPINWEEKIGKYKNYSEATFQSWLMKLQEDLPQKPSKEVNKKNFFFWLAKAYIDDKQYKKAASFLTILVKQYPHEQRFIFFLSRMYDLLGEHDKSIALLDNFKQDDQYIEAKKLLNKARGLLKYKRSEEALLELIKAEVKGDKYPIVLQEIGKIYLKLQKIDDAERLQIKASKLSPLNYNLKTNLAQTMMTKRNLQGAKEIIDESLALHSFQPYGHFIKGEILQLLEEPNNAVRSYNHALNQNENLKRARLALIGLYHSLPDQKEQCEIHEKILLSQLKSSRNIILGSSPLTRKKVNEMMPNCTSLLFNKKTGKAYQQAQIDQLISKATTNPIITLPRYAFSLSPLHKFKILYIQPDLTNIEGLKLKVDEEKLLNRIGHTKAKLKQLNNLNPHLTIKIIYESDLEAQVINDFFEIPQYSSNP